jgi:hypothetical protein
MKVEKRVDTMESLTVVQSVVYLAVRKVYGMVAQMADSMVVMLAAC